jgi:hypothetical protein
MGRSNNSWRNNTSGNKPGKIPNAKKRESVTLFPIIYHMNILFYDTSSTKFKQLG